MGLLLLLLELLSGAALGVADEVARKKAEVVLDAADWVAEATVRLCEEPTDALEETEEIVEAVEAVELGRGAGSPCRFENGANRCIAFY